MDTSNALIGGVIFILLVAGANLVMYAIVRGAARPGGRKGFLETFVRSLNPPTKTKDDSIEELRRRVDQLKQAKKEGGGDTE